MQTYIAMHQTKHGWNLKLKIRPVASVPVSANVYSVYVRQKKDASAQIFSLDYGDRMRVFDAKGSLRSTRKWSSKVRCIAALPDERRMTCFAPK